MKKKIIITGVVNAVVIALMVVLLTVPQIFDSILSFYWGIIGGTKAGGGNTTFIKTNGSCKPRASR